jgi:phospholipid-transporting ATPase
VGGRGSYFLVIAILASIAEISPVSGSTFWLPLGVVLTFTMLKDGYEDYQRYKSDVEENSRVTEVWIAAERDFRAVPWKDVQVGSVVRVRANDPQSSPMIPADLSLLATAAEDGTCFLETANLDGETNLKLREAPEATHRRLARGEEVDLAALAALAVEVTCTVPDAYLYDFNARMELDGQDVSLSGGAGGGQFLQRSTKLRNTKWVLGVAVYTGRETKIQMNMSDPPNKVSPPPSPPPTLPPTHPLPVRRRGEREWHRATRCRASSARSTTSSSPSSPSSAPYAPPAASPPASGSGSPRPRPRGTWRPNRRPRRST